MSTISHELVTSRKAHQCTYCERIIAAGSSVVRHVYRDGGICTSYAHAECQLAAEWAKWKLEDYECPPDGPDFIERELASYRAAKPKETPCQD